MSAVICFKHGIDMPVVGDGPELRFTAPLHRCPLCTAEFRAALAKALSYRVHGRVGRQHTLPPVIMSERWPS